MRARDLAVLLAALCAPGAASPAEPASLDAARGAPAAEVSERGDRAFARGELRAALFAYQDAVYLAPASAAARVKLGRAYLALGYRAQARGQAEQALALDAGSAEARRLLDDAIAGRAPPHRVAAPGPARAESAVSAAGAPSGAATGAAPGSGASGRPAGESAVSAAGAPSGAATGAAAGSDAPGGPAGEPATRAGAPEAPAGELTVAALRYRAGVDLFARGDYEGAAAALDLAIAADRGLGVAYAARGSARAGLGRLREAAEDYRTAMALAPGLGTPLYGLAECYRADGDTRAADLYRRYAESRAADVREDLRTLAVRRVAELQGR